MATITIKIDSDELAREVLTQLGYLPCDDDVPDLISVDDEEPEEVRPAPKTHVACSDELLTKVPFIPSLHTMATREVRSHAEAMACADDLMSKPTRKMPDAPKQSAFCTTEDPKPDVEPVDNELGSSLDVFSEETTKERDELYNYCLEVHKSLMAEGRLKAMTEQLVGDELLNCLDAMCENADEKMREAAKAMVRKEFTGHTLKMWPALQKVLDDSP